MQDNLWRVIWVIKLSFAKNVYNFVKENQGEIIKLKNNVEHLSSSNRKENLSQKSFNAHFYTGIHKVS